MVLNRNDFIFDNSIDMDKRLPTLGVRVTVLVVKVYDKVPLNERCQD